MVETYAKLLKEYTKNQYIVDSMTKLVKVTIMDEISSLAHEFRDSYLDDRTKLDEIYDKLFPQQKEILDLIDKWGIKMEVPDKMKISYMYDLLLKHY